MTLATLETITETAAERWRQRTVSPRLAELLPVLIRHLHAFARDIRLTRDEWEAGIEFLTATGRLSGPVRSEFILLSDVLGLSMLVALQNDEKPEQITRTTLLGPFYIKGSPVLENGFDLGAGIDGDILFVSGRVRDARGAPIAGATVDTWQSDAEGIYEQQIPDCDVRLRGIFNTDADGRYAFRTVVPADYPIPVDGPVGTLIGHTTISIYRPAHIHFILSAAGHRTLITHVFRNGSPCLDSDVVFGVRPELVADFVRHPAGPTPDGGSLSTPFYTLEYDFTLEDA